jgi:ribonuclease P protein component
MAFVREWPPRAAAACWRRGAPRAASACLPDPGGFVIPLARATTPRTSLADEKPPQAVRLVRLKTRADFLRVAASRRRAVQLGLLLQASPQPPGTDGDAVRVGFTASRKVGNAVVRNQAKRRLRAAAAEVLGRSGRPGTDYVLIARAGTAERSYAELVGDLDAALRQVDRGGESRPRRGEEV